MFGSFRKKSPSRGKGEGAGAGAGNGAPHVAKHTRHASRSSALPQIPPSVKAEEPPLVTVTSDLPEYGGYGGSPSPRRNQGPARSTTPGRARLEVVLNVSPYKPLPGQKLWAEADMAAIDDGDGKGDGGKDELVSRKRKVAPTMAASSPRLAHNSAMPAHAATGKRSRGRPKGWRPGMPSTKTGLLTASAFRYLDKDGNRIVPPTSPMGPKSGVQKRRGRPPRAPSPTPREVWERLAPPPYVPFICEWKGCKAELQNMETLRRHVRKLHGLGHGGMLSCRWGRCGRQEQGQEPSFTLAGLHAHMERRHLMPLVWYVGDGVRNERLMDSEQPTKDEDQVPGYLLGANGEQITPWVKGQEVEDFVTWRENRNRLKQILLQRDQNAPLEDEDEEDMDEAGAVA